MSVSIIFERENEVMAGGALTSVSSARSKPAFRHDRQTRSSRPGSQGGKGISMARKHYNEDLRRRVLQEVEDGATVGEVAHRYGIAEATYYRWRERLRAVTGVTSRETQRLEDENRRLRDILTDTMLENRALRQEVDRLRRSGATVGDD